MTTCYFIRPEDGDYPINEFSFFTDKEEAIDTAKMLCTGGRNWEIFEAKMIGIVQIPEPEPEYFSLENIENKEP